MRILLTNDDGILAPGLQALWARLKGSATLDVVAPLTERSAVGHAITLSDPLRVETVRGPRGFSGLAVTGTPADCVKIAVRTALAEPPDLVVSGINAGANVGTNVLYSGTVSAATEASFLGLPAIAVSVRGKPVSYGPAAEFTARLVELVATRGLPPGVSLNVNVPNLPLSRIKGMKVTRMGGYKVTEWFDRRVDPRGRVYYWQAGEMAEPEVGAGPDTDDNALRAGYVSVTPLYPDLTAHSFLPELMKTGLFSD
jgi:5'-nucleotidase